MTESIEAHEPEPGRRGPLPYSGEVGRKALHLLALAMPLGMVLVGKVWSVSVLVPLALVAVGADVLRARSEGFNQFIRRYFGFMMRMKEMPPVGEPVAINGASWVMVSAALLAVVFPISIAVPAFAMFMLGDAAAALIGRRFGRWHWGRSPRTVEGSLAFLLTGLLFMALYPNLPFWIGTIGVVVATVFEALPGPFNDSVRVPFVTALVIFLIERYALGMAVGLFFA